ncbi:MAG: hypothetical protein G01um101419_165 [Parcubacteria group bacterium Gr01-1014_19]|nr:MAG: hypothetical protein G01um101419_165 [Parcubacteria group bacterium Gr01-1014_19]
MGTVSEKDRERIAKLKEDDIGMLVFKDDKEILEYIRKSGIVIDQDGLPISETASLPSTKNTAANKIAVKGMPDSPDAWKKAWQDFYLEVYRMKFDFSDLVIPEKVQDSALVIVANGLTSALVIENIRPQRKITTVIELEKSSIRSCRDASKRSYAIWLRTSWDPVELNPEIQKNKDLCFPTSSTLEEELLWRMFCRQREIEDVEPGKDEFIVCLASQGKFGSEYGFPKLGIRSSKSTGSSSYYDSWGDYRGSDRRIIRRGGLYLNIFSGKLRRDEDEVKIFTRSVSV